MSFENTLGSGCPHGQMPTSPEAIAQLKEVWGEILVILRDIAGTKEQAADKHVAGKEVLTKDIEEAIADVTANHDSFNTVQRKARIVEMTSLS